jgi:hypothetical protein
MKFGGVDALFAYFEDPMDLMNEIIVTLFRILYMRIELGFKDKY